jgi:hypothetical protein
MRNGRSLKPIPRRHPACIPPRKSKPQQTAVSLTVDRTEQLVFIPAHVRNVHPMTALG